MQRAYLKNDGRQYRYCGQNFPVQTLTHGTKGGSRGKSKVFPRAPCAWLSPKSKAHSNWLAVCIAQSRYCEQCRTDKYGCVRMCTEEGHMVQCVPCAVKFQKHMALRQPCANCPLCPLCPSCPFSLPALHSSVRSGGGPPPCALHNGHAVR